MEEIVAGTTVFFPHISFSVNCGSDVCFWEDTWIGASPLKQQFPSLYRIALNRKASFADVLGANPPNIAFRRAIVGNRLVAWLELCHKLESVNFVDQADSFTWNLNSSGSYSMKSLYKSLINNDCQFRHKVIWKLKVPLKIKFFAWYLCRGVVLTKDNLAKRNWGGSKKCVYYDQDETIQHLFFQCPMARLVWRTVFVTFNLPPPSCVTNMFGR